MPDLAMLPHHCPHACSWSHMTTLCWVQDHATAVAFPGAAVHGGGRSKLPKCSQTVVPIACQSARSKAVTFSKVSLQLGQDWERNDGACERSPGRRAAAAPAPGSSPARTVTIRPGLENCPHSRQAWYLSTSISAELLPFGDVPAMPGDWLCQSCPTVAADRAAVVAPGILDVSQHSVGPHSSCPDSPPLACVWEAAFVEAAST